MADKDKSLEVKSFYAEDQTTGDQASGKKYLFRMISPDGTKERRWEISSGVLRFGVFSMVVGALLLIGTGALTVYGALNFRLNQAAVTDMERSTELQQEQLLSLSKKTGKLSEQLQNLTQMERELRIQAGVTPLEEKKDESKDDQSKDQTSEAPRGSEELSEPTADEFIDDEYDGQGGPIEGLDVESVGEALSMLESGIVERRGSLVQLQDELKKQREQIASIVNQRSAMAAATQAMQSFTTQGEFGSIPFTNAPVSNNSFALGLTDAASNVPAIWPTTGVVTSPYGLRWGGTDFHPGIDIANDLGTPIVATADGVVVYAGWNAGGYGNMVDIDHGNGLMTRYGHASQVVVSAGQFVRRGQVIALMGSTGFSTGPHVHYEVHVNGQRVNPISYL